MTIRDHRLKAAARHWDRAQLQAGGEGDRPGATRKAAWAAKRAARLHERVKKHMVDSTTTITTTTTTTKERTP